MNRRISLVFALVVLVQAHPGWPDRRLRQVNRPSQFPANLCGDPLPEGALARTGTSRFRHEANVNALVFSPDGKTLISAGMDRTIRSWNAATGAPLFRLQTNTWVAYLALAADGKFLVSVDVDNLVQIWQMPAAKELARIAKFRRERGSSRGLMAYAALPSRPIARPWLLLGPHYQLLGIRTGKH